VDADARTIHDVGCAAAVPTGERWCAGCRVSQHAQLRLLQRLAPGWHDEEETLRRAAVGLQAALTGNTTNRDAPRVLLHSGWSWIIGDDTLSHAPVLVTCFPTAEGDTGGDGDHVSATGDVQRDG